MAGRRLVGARVRRRASTPLLVVTLHVVLWLGLQARAPDPVSPRAADSAPLQTFLWMPPVQRGPTRAAPSWPARAPRPRAAPSPAGSPVTEATPGDAAPAPPIDWDAAARAAVGRHAQLPEPRRDCDEDPPPGSMRPRCKPLPHAFGWHREPRTVEWEGLLPYVHLGKRCVVGLGFFGCAVGDLPQADGHLLDGMREPDRDRSSVPEVPGAGSR